MEPLEGRKRPADDFRVVHARIWAALGPKLEVASQLEGCRLPPIPSGNKRSELIRALHCAGISIVDEDISQAVALCPELAGLQRQIRLTPVERMLALPVSGYVHAESTGELKRKFSLPGYQATFLTDEDGEVLGHYGNRIVQLGKNPTQEADVLKALNHLAPEVKSTLRGATVSLDNEAYITPKVQGLTEGARRLLYLMLHASMVSELRTREVPLAVTVCRPENPALKSHLLCGWRQVAGHPQRPPKDTYTDTLSGKAGHDWVVLVLDPMSHLQTTLIKFMEECIPLTINDPGRLAAMKRKPPPVA